MTKHVISFKRGSRAAQKREEIVKALKKKGLPKKAFKGRTKRASRFAIATDTAKNQFIKKRFM